MGSRLSNPFHDGIGGPGGWIIINEPTIHFRPGRSGGGEGGWYPGEWTADWA